MNRKFRIGTRSSELAMWQTNLVASKLNKIGVETEIVPIESLGDIVLDQPLHTIGTVGLFTKSLDTAMLGGKIDLAVHSMKDVPTTLPQGIVEAAVLERANHFDILVKKSNKVEYSSKCVIATGSLRRQAQWKAKYPHHELVDLRGNVNTRLQKLKDNDWQGAVFAAAGLERINLMPENYEILDWMIPAPAQGAIMITVPETDKEAIAICEKIHHDQTHFLVWQEREFMKKLEGGCTAPIGAYAYMEGDNVVFEGVLSAIDGKEQNKVQLKKNINDASNIGTEAAELVLKDGGVELLKEIKAFLKS